MTGARKQNTAIVGAGVAACAVCCAGPILGVLAAIGLGTAVGFAVFGVGFAVFGSLAILIGAAAVALVFVRRRADSCPPAETPQAVLVELTDALVRPPLTRRPVCPGPARGPGWASCAGSSFSGVVLGPCRAGTPTVRSRVAGRDRIGARQLAGTDSTSIAARPVPTSTLRGLACSATGMRSVSTPSVKSASMRSASRPSPRCTCRRYEPR